MKALILTVLTLVACGEQPTDNVGNDKKVAVDTSTEKQKPAASTAMLIGSLKNMPACIDDMEGQLIYVKEDKQFYFCESESWTKIDLSGKNGSNGKDGSDGEDGTNGVDGIDGQDGLAGSNGTNGTNGVDGKDGNNTMIAVDDHSWIHPITGNRWFIGKTISSIYYSGNVPNLLDDHYICPAGSRSPTKEEYLDAFDFGIWYKFSAFAPILVTLGDPGYTVPYQYGPQNTVGTEIFYKFIVGNASGVVESYIGSGTVYGKAVCIID